MRIFILVTLILCSSPLALNADLHTDAYVARTGTDFIIPRARLLLHRWIEPAYQVRMLASFSWTQKDGSSTIF